MIRCMGTKKHVWMIEDTGTIIRLPYKGIKGKKYKLEMDTGVCLVTYQGESK